MNVELLSVTPDALDLMLFTKNTRLSMSGIGLDEVKAWPQEKKDAELKYMLGTIQSSWEFVDYVFAITGVTRAFTHQLVRHRVGTSFAQQSQRAVDMSGFEYVVPTSLNADNPGIGEARDASPAGFSKDYGLYIARQIARIASGEETNVDNINYITMHAINLGYAKLITLGVPPQDARGVLPTNISTNIIFKANLRTLHEMMMKRLCVKAQGEFQDVARAMRAAVIRVHPWAEPFLRVGCAATGVCIFPGVPVDECHVKPHVFNPETGLRWDEAKYLEFVVTGETLIVVANERPATKDEIQQLWQLERREVVPTV